MKIKIFRASKPFCILCVVPTCVNSQMSQPAFTTQSTLLRRLAKRLFARRQITCYRSHFELITRSYKQLIFLRHMAAVVLHCYQCTCLLIIRSRVQIPPGAELFSSCYLFCSLTFHQNKSLSVINQVLQGGASL